ncbi:MULTISPECIES: formate dehydrogenase subunit delta [Bordetella]|uniref:Formate dehydrogenase n=1 Tax=Bordetella genomosp. 6 TaxID=463024 RepID=A0ABX4F8X1_9BORD|nr:MULTISPECIES: formate dehydrogenase subunit delta [Bordetella]AOB25887.1 formate dehydrogenase [Bordetella bronchiseptica]AZW43160.1 formate dehydrogenase [Bordetella bronchiseptica]KCV66673.1 NADH-dependent formate dehydrogenase delta subunit FdsD [Bordetella bronchiseptica 99-R-0433]MBN3268584.1 formate dehydrogenase [Bordetella bronchiseptica]OZI72975.1 formate dehydrogenase [Bordetella genomosp. 6]
MEIGNLIRMANRIGDFFDAYPDRAEAQAGIATHIQKFWEPRMRIQLLAFVARHPDGDDGQARLNGIVLNAVRDAQARLTPKA